jgi:hypothetical protein
MMDEKDALSLDTFGKIYKELSDEEKEEIENMLAERKSKIMKKEI